MILIPEIETVVVLVPRTGSGSLYRAVVKEYPRAMLVYRHMEADGVPQGYDRWPKIGVVRNPLDRLWSLYKPLEGFSGNREPSYIQEMRRSVEVPFSDWILHNKTVFTSPYDSSGSGRFFPAYTVRHPLPETRKSQFLYLRPDLGTEIYKFQDLHKVEERIGVSLGRFNETDCNPCPLITASAIDHMERWFKWDYKESI